jgi:hypothetical protein
MLAFGGWAMRRLRRRREAEDEGRVVAVCVATGKGPGKGVLVGRGRRGARRRGAPWWERERVPGGVVRQTVADARQRPARLPRCRRAHWVESRKVPVR